MRRRAGRLGIAIPEATWPSLVQAATFQQMGEAADQLSPLRIVGNDHAAFFRKGTEVSSQRRPETHGQPRAHGC
jgi:aryl sulfotransferase